MVRAIENGSIIGENSGKADSIMVSAVMPTSKTRCDIFNGSGVELLGLSKSLLSSLRKIPSNTRPTSGKVQ